MYALAHHVVIIQFPVLVMGQEGVLRLPQWGTHTIMWSLIEHRCRQWHRDGQVSSVIQTSVTGILRMPLQLCHDGLRFLNCEIAYAYYAKTAPSCCSTEARGNWAWVSRL